MNNNLISREALRKRTIEFRDRLKESGQLNLPSGFGAFLDFIKEAPAVDAVEVVRCKDCKYSGMYWFGTEDTPRLACLDTDEDGAIYYASATEPMWFCSSGDRKAEKDLKKAQI